MPSIDDLHTAFDDLEAAAPADVPERRRRSARLPMLAAAAAVVAVTVFAVAVGMHRATLADRPAAQSSPASPSSAPTTARTGPGPVPGPDLRRFTFSIGTLAGVTTVYTSIDASHQGAELDLEAGDRSAVGWVNVYRSGASAPQRPSDAKAVIVNGHSGFSGYIAATLPGMVAASDGPGLFAVAWQYEPGAWAVAQQGYPPAGATAPPAMQIARAVDTSSRHPVRVPARVGYLPAGFTLSGVDVVPQDGFFTTTIDLAATGRRVPMSVTVSTVGTGQTGPYPVGLPAGSRGVAVGFGLWEGNYDRTCGSMWVVKGGIGVSISTENALGVSCRGAAVLSRAQLQRIVEQLALCPAPNDPSSWYSLRFALP